MGVNKVAVITGGRGTGKTEETKKAIRIALASRPNLKCLIVNDADTDTWRYIDAFDQPQVNSIPIIDKKDIPFWEGEPRLMRTADGDVDKTIIKVKKYCTNMLLVIEDTSRHYEGHCPPFLKTLVLNSKQYNIDILFVYHFIAQIPPRLANLLDILQLHYTGDEYGSEIKKRFKNPKVRTALHYLNQCHKKYMKVKEEVEQVPEPLRKEKFPAEKIEQYNHKFKKVVLYVGP